MEYLGRPFTLEENLLDGAGSSTCTIQEGLSGRSTPSFASPEEAYAAELGEFEHQWRDILGSIQDTTFGDGRFYFSDVVACADEAEADDVCTQLIDRGRDYRGNLLIISRHGDHVHAIHDCPYSNRYVNTFKHLCLYDSKCVVTYRSCRCTFLQSPFVQANLRRTSRKRRRISTLGARDWRNILLYFSEGGRTIDFIKVRGSARRVPVSTSRVEINRPRGTGEVELVGGCGLNYKYDVSSAVEDGTTHRRGKRAVSHLRQHSQPQGGQGIIQKMEKVLMSSPVCPMIGIVDSDLWLNDPDLMYLRKDNKTVQNVLDTWAQKTCRWSIFDFNTFYSRDNCTPLFWAGYREFDSVYYDVEQSLEVVDRLLKFQCNQDAVQVQEFLQDCFVVMERKIPKLGTLLIKSAPSAGKNFLMEVFLDYYWNRGQLGNLNKNNQFGLQEAAGKRILLWDEPNYESGMVETLKNVTAGHPFCARVKCKGDAAVYSTPLIILTNRNISLLSNPAFNDRMRVHHWVPASFLKDYNKKPNPLCLYPLMLRWGIILPNPMNFVSTEMHFEDFIDSE